MKYTVLLEKRAEKELRRLPCDILLKVDKRILALMKQPRPEDVKKLKGKEKEGWRIRVGNYRILYRIDDSKNEIRVYRIKHRKEAFR